MVHQHYAFTIGLSTFITLCLSRVDGGGTHIIYGYHMWIVQSLFLQNIQNPMVKPLCNKAIALPIYIHIPTTFPSHVETPTSHLSINPIPDASYKEMAWWDYSYPSIEGSDTAHRTNVSKQPIIGVLGWMLDQ